MAWIFVGLIYIIALSIDGKIQYNSKSFIKMKIRFFGFFFRHNKQYPNEIALATFIVQLISLVLLVVSICLLIISLFLAEIYSKWFAEMCLGTVFITFIIAGLFYSFKYGKKPAPEPFTKDRKGYVESSKTTFGRNELNSQSIDEQNKE